MQWMIELLAVIPKSVQIVVASILLGAGAVSGLETRYMTVSDFTKSYVLDLKAAIRDLRNDLQVAQSDRERAWLREQIELLLDELCYEMPSDPYCDKR